MANSPLLRFESMVRRLVEQPFAWLSGESADPFGMASHLLQLLLEERQNGRRVAQFTITMNPVNFASGNPDPEQLAEMVSAYLVLLAERTGTSLVETPVIRIAQDPAVGNRLATVVAAEEALDPATRTQLYKSDASGDFLGSIRDRDAFLIIQGRQHFPLDRPVIRIGRRADNDIVLDSPTVSRHHAQVRWRDQGFVLFDTSSHGRTIVNGEPKQEHCLEPGDVIAISDVLLIYGEERFDSEPLTFETSPISTTMLKPPE